jgi:flagellar FliL protein
MADETKEAPEKAAGGGGSKIVPILLGVNMLLVVGVIALFMLKGGASAGAATPAAGGHGEEKPAAEAHGEGGGEGGPGPTTKMADFVVHLRDAEVDRYARISFEVELASEPDKAKFDRFTPRIRDGFIAYLSDRTLEELRGSEQVKKVKLSLQEQLKELAPGARVRALYITDLVIQ